jgi:hypothetical protein
MNNFPQIFICLAALNPEIRIRELMAFRTSMRVGVMIKPGLCSFSWLYLLEDELSSYSNFSQR